MLTEIWGFGHRWLDKIGTKMLFTAEIRLFWFHDKPEEFEDWFKNDPGHPFPAGGPEERNDVYLRDPSQIELGVKTRGEKPGVEVKGLVATLGGTVDFNSLEIPIELWSKWPSQKLGFDTQAGVTLHKTRWLRKFDTAAAQPVEIALDSAYMLEKGSTVEWTIVQMPSGEACWTLAFEAFGGLQDVESSLRSVAQMMSDRNPPRALRATAMSYPALIAHIDRANLAGIR